MDIFQITSSYDHGGLIENFTSFIWTERYRDVGEFEITTDQIAYMKDKLPIGSFLGRDGSDRFMWVESHLEERDAEGVLMLTVKGRSAEAIFTKRQTMPGGTTVEYWSIPGSISTVALTIVKAHCVDGTGPGGIYDRVPGMTAADISGYGGAATVVNVPPGQMLQRLQEVCDIAGLGFRISLGAFTGIDFYIYQGTNRTTTVIFSPELETLSEVSALVSDKEFANVAYMYGEADSNFVYRGTTPVTVAGWDRRVVYSDANDIKSADPDKMAKLNQRGQSVLSANRRLSMIDGTVDPAGRYVYGTHYFLGDFVTTRKDDVSEVKQVTEHILIIDKEGMREYPTLA